MNNSRLENATREQKDRNKEIEGCSAANSGQPQPDDPLPSTSTDLSCSLLADCVAFSDEEILTLRTQLEKVVSFDNYSSFLIWFIACPAALPMYCRSVAEIYAFLFCHDYYLLLSRIKHFRFLWWSCTCQCSQFGFKYAGKSTHYSLLLLNKRLLICLIFYSMSWTKKCTREMRQACSEFPHFRELSSVLMT